MDVGSLLRDLRRRAGLSQAELAGRAGSSQAAVSRRESGAESPTVEMLEHLAFASGARISVETKMLPPSVLRRALFEKRSSLIDCIEKHGATQPRVFGSVARGEDTGSSDIDLLVTVNAQAPRSELLTLLTLSEELTKIVGAPVEVSSERILDPDVRRNALQDAVAL